MSRYEGAELNASFIKLTAQIPDEASAIRYVESVRWPDGVWCPRCGSFGVKRSSRPNRPLEWVCFDCGKQFSVISGTVMQATKLPLRTWLIAWHLMASSRKGISARQLQELLDIRQYRSAWHLAHRIRKAIEQNPNAPPMKGIIETDEVYIGGRRKHMGRGYRGNKVAVQTILQRGRFKTRKIKGGKKRSRFDGGGLVERGVSEGHSIARSVILHPDAERVDGRTLGAKLRKYTDPSRSRLMTDESPAYLAPGSDYLSHERVHHKKGDYAHVDPKSGRLVSTNEVEGFFANMRRQISGTHHHTSKQHLPRYLTEFDFKFNKRELSGGDRMLATMRNAEGKRLTLYKSEEGGDALRGRRGAKGAGSVKKKGKRSRFDGDSDEG